MFMTEGSIRKNIIRFSVPIMISYAFQQLYTIVDSAVVGNFVGTEALAGVSATNALIFMIVGFFIGTFSGAGVVISKYWGAREFGKVSDASHTAIVLGLVFGVGVTIIGVILTPEILKLMKTPAEVFPQAVTYLRYYFGGSIFIVLFNTANGIHQAVGDSKHPLYYLIVATILNIVLDFLLVGYFDFGIAGAAVATVIAQAVSAVCSLWHLARVDEPYKLKLSGLRSGFSREIFNKMLIFGVPAGIQNSVLSIGNVVIQANVNAFGAAAIAGSGAYFRVEGIAFIPITSIAMALTTFVSQNLGAGEHQRAKDGARFGIFFSMILAEGIALLIMLNARFLVGIFDPSADVINIGVIQSHVSPPFFFLLAFSHAAAGILRGSGRSFVPMVVMLCFWCIFRVAYVTVAVYFFPVIQTVFWAYPITWSLSSIAFVIYLKKRDWVHGLD